MDSELTQKIHDKIIDVLQIPLEHTKSNNVYRRFNTHQYLQAGFVSVCYLIEHVCSPDLITTRMGQQIANSIWSDNAKPTHPKQVAFNAMMKKNRELFMEGFEIMLNLQLKYFGELNNDEFIRESIVVLIDQIRPSFSWLKHLEIRPTPN